MEKYLIVKVSEDENYEIITEFHNLQELQKLLSTSEDDMQITGPITRDFTENQSYQCHVGLFGGSSKAQRLGLTKNREPNQPW